MGAARSWKHSQHFAAVLNNTCLCIWTAASDVTAACHRCSDAATATDLDDGQPVADDRLQQGDQPRHEEDAADDARQIPLGAALNHDVRLVTTITSAETLS